MAEKKVLTRVILKHDTAENWAKATNFVPNKGEFIIYDTLDASGNKVADAVRYKIGDGKTNVNSLPFAVVDGTTSTKGIVKLEDSTTSTSTTTAATPNSVKAAYDKANEVAEDLAELEGSLASVAKSGSYTDLNDKPAIPTIPTLTITDKSNTDTDNLIYAVTNLVESGTNGHTVTATYTGLPTKTYVDTEVGEVAQTAAEAKATAEGAIVNPSKAITTSYNAQTNTVTFS